MHRNRLISTVIPPPKKADKLFIDLTDSSDEVKQDTVLPTPAPPRPALSKSVFKMTTPRPSHAKKTKKRSNFIVIDSDDEESQSNSDSDFVAPRPSSKTTTTPNFLSFLQANPAAAAHSLSQAVAEDPSSSSDFTDPYVDEPLMGGAGAAQEEEEKEMMDIVEETPSLQFLPFAPTSFEAPFIQDILPATPGASSYELFEEEDDEKAEVQAPTFMDLVLENVFVPVAETKAVALPEPEVQPELITAKVSRAADESAQQEKPRGEHLDTDKKRKMPKQRRDRLLEDALQRSFTPQGEKRDRKKPTRLQ